MGMGVDVWTPDRNLVSADAIVASADIMPSIQSHMPQPGLAHGAIGEACDVCMP